MTFIYNSREGGKFNPDRCAASVMRGGFWRHQCHRKGVVTRKVKEGTFKFCHQHDPVEREKRFAERVKKYDERSKQRFAIYDTAEKYRKALEQISKGKGDARAIAAKALS